MPPEVPDKNDGGDAFDVVLVHGATTDGKGARVLRARPGQIETGEVRPLREGQPLAPGGEVVRLSERAGTPLVYDVHGDYAPSAPPEPRLRASAAGPAQVASPAYRASWDRTFAKSSSELN